VALHWKPHSAHWGVFRARWHDGTLAVLPHPGDPDPNPLIDNLPSALRHPVRVRRPMVRQGWLEQGPGPDTRRGRDRFVPVPWDEVLDRLAAELRRVQAQHGAQGFFGGSYGWSSAGRFHHAQSQVHRFLNTALGGYVRSVNSYSAGAAGPMLPHVMGAMEEVARRNVSWEQIVQHTDVVLAFGGMALKNIARGQRRHQPARGAWRHGAGGGARLPLRRHQPAARRHAGECGAFEWLARVPGTDTALMLALVHTLVDLGLHDQAFIERWCDGWDRFEDYLLGRSDGQPKNANWAQRITGLPAADIVALARSLHGRRVLVCVAHALQRAEHGEQPVWMGAVLAAALGQIGLPGGGYAYALGTLAHYGKRQNAVPSAALPQGRNGVSAFIPVARIADMLLDPGAPFRYDGRTHAYPHVRLAYWAGGNPFHHHQDLARLHLAFGRLDTFIVHESVWTATARHADIVLPATLTLEREDIGAAPTDPLMVAMHRVLPPHGQARDDFDIFADLAERMGLREAFTEGRDTRQWLQHLYEKTRAALQARGDEAPDFDRFWARGELRLPQQADDGGILRAFRDDPEGRPLPTESGRVQIHSPRIAAFGDADCPGHPAWLPPDDAPDDRHPLWLLANQPATQLHSQGDPGAHTQSTRRQGRQVCRLHPADAAARGIASGDAVRIFNVRGDCLAVAALDDALRPGVLQLPTGGWADPPPDAQGRRQWQRCVRGNPNVLTRDRGTSSLAQGCTGQLTAVQVERWDHPLPTLRAYDAPVEA
jgi:biotin/methionine sulfoxide reductase